MVTPAGGCHGRPFLVTMPLIPASIYRLLELLRTRQFIEVTAAD